MSAIRGFLGRARGRAAVAIERTRLPRVVTVTDFDVQGVRFEISNMTERHRVINHGDETAYLHAMLAELRSTDVLYDVGVCVGLVALHAARRCRVVGFEPDPAFRQRTERNLEINPDIQIELLPYAISDRDGEVTLYTDGAAGNSPSLRHQRGESGRAQVEARSLDSLVSRGLTPPTVVKLDIEGAELPALRGARSLLTSSASRPRLLFLELHHEFIPAFGGTAHDVMDIVTQAGYTPIYSASRLSQDHLILAADGS